MERVKKNSESNVARGIIKYYGDKWFFFSSKNSKTCERASQRIKNSCEFHVPFTYGCQTHRKIALKYINY